MLKRLFEMELSQFGFDPDSMNISWDVGFCQSDFVTFSGRVGLDSVQKLMMKMHGIDVGPSSDEHHLLPDDLQEMLKVLEAYGSIDLTLVSNGYRIPSISVETDDDFEWIFDHHYQSMIADFNDTIDWDRQKDWNVQWFAFLKWLKEAHSELCHRMLCRAHDILLFESTDEVVYERVFGKYFIQCVESKDKYLGELVSEMDELEAFRFYKSFQNQLKYGCLQVNIYDLARNRLLGSSSYYSFLTSAIKPDATYKALRRKAFQEAAEDVRDLISRHSLAA